MILLGRAAAGWSVRSVAGAGAAFVLGAALAQALAPLHHLWTVLPALAGISWLMLRASSARAGALAGWLFGLGYFAFGLSWIVEPFQIDPERHAWMAPFALVFLAGGLALFWAAAFGLAVRFAKGGRRVLLLIALWMLAEFARAYVFTGFPWAAFGQFWIDTPAALLLPYAGPHGLALLTLAAALPLALLPQQPVAALLPGGLAAALVFLLPAPPPQAALSGDTVRIVQPNAPQDQKWHPDTRWTFVRRALDYTAAAPAEGAPAPSLVVWPETTVPQLLNHADDVLLAASGAAGGVPVLLGIQREDSGRYYNSAVLLEPDGQVRQIYDKAHLVPFGEYVPLGNLMARFGIHGFASQAGAGYSAGPGAELLETPLGGALPLICYEAVFPQDVNGAASRPDVLMQITNDAWFGTYSGPYQHLVQARMRAAEQGLPMVRAANTGVSAMIDPYGRLRETLPLGEAGYFDAALPASLPVTFYSRTGDMPMFLFCILLGGLAVWPRRRVAERS